VSFRRALRGNVLNKWLELVIKIINEKLSAQEDVFMWGLGDRKKFTVNSMYSDIMKQQGIPSNCSFWELRIPLKIKIIMWHWWKGVILTKDNLAKRKWKGGVKCCLCNSSETIQHLFFDCHLARNIWNLVFITFGIQPPTSVSHLLGSWLRGFSKSPRSQGLWGSLLFVGPYG
jgi:hypothetical protein